MGGCSLLHWFGRPVSQLPQASLRAEVAGGTILVELSGLMHRALAASANDKEAEQLAHHLQGKREFAPPRLVEKVVRYVFTVVKNIVKHCASVILVLEGSHPTKSCRHERVARRIKAYQNCNWRAAICPSDCMTRALMMEISHCQETSGAGLPPECDITRLRVHCAVYEADGFICHSLLQAQPGSTWAMVFSNDCDFAVHDERIAEYCVYNCQVSEDDIVGSLLCHEEFVQRNQVSLRDWPVIKRIACVTLAGNDFFKRENIGPERAFDIIERLWQAPSKASPLDNLTRIQAALRDPSFDKRHPLKPGYNGYVTACLSTICMLVDTGKESLHGDILYDTMYPVKIFHPATPEQVTALTPYQLTLDHRGWSGTRFAEIGQKYLHVGDHSCTVTLEHFSPVTSESNPQYEPEPEAEPDAKPSNDTGVSFPPPTTASQLFELHQKHMAYSPMVWTIDHGGEVLDLRIGQRLSFLSQDVASAEKASVKSLKFHCQRQGHNVRVTRSSGQGGGQDMKVTVACSHQSRLPGKPSEATTSSVTEEASVMQPIETWPANSPIATVFPLEPRTQADLDKISSLPRGGLRQHAALAGCVLATHAVPAAEVFNSALLRAAKGGKYADMDQKARADYVCAVCTEMSLVASRSPDPAGTGVPDKIGGQQGSFSDHLRGVLSALEKGEGGTLRTCMSLRADESSSVISSADACTSDYVICIRRIDERSMDGILQLSGHGRRSLATWKEELAVNAVLLGKPRGLFVAFTVDKETGELGRREIIECLDLDLARGNWAISCISSARARLHALPIEVFPPRHQHLKLPVPVLPPQKTKRHAVSRISSQMGHVCYPLCRLRLHFFELLSVKLQVHVPGARPRPFTVAWTVGHQKRQCSLPRHVPSHGGCEFRDDDGAVLNLSEPQRADVRSWLVHLENSTDWKAFLRCAAETAPFTPSLLIERQQRM